MMPGNLTKVGFYKGRIFWVALAVAGAASGVLPSHAERISNPIALFSGLDKITGITISFEVKVGESYSFGGLRITPRVCYTREITEEPKTTSWVVVDQIELNKTTKQIFAGWMFAESPGLNGVEHPIYDVWLTGCRDPNAPPVPTETAPAPVAPGESSPDAPAAPDD